MGLRNSKYWKDFLKKLIMDTFNTEITQPTTIPLRQSVSIFDFNIKTHSVLFNDSITTWEDYATSMYKNITNECKSHVLEDIILCVDDPTLVPRNKGQTQKARDSKVEDKKLSVEDVSTIIVGKGNIVPQAYSSPPTSTSLPRNVLNVKDFKKAMLEHRSIKFLINSWLVCQVVKKASLEKKVKIMAESIDATVFRNEFPEVDFPLEFKKIRFVAHVDHNNSYNNIKLQVGPADNIVGEGEQLCVKYMNNVNPYSEGEGIVRIVIHSTDTDFITYLLCHGHNLISPVTKDFNKQVYLMDSTQVWDVNKMYVHLYKYFSMKSMDVPSPILLLCLIMIIDGNDFTEGLKGITAETILEKFFLKDGYKLWQYSKYGIRPFMCLMEFGNRNKKEKVVFEEGILEEYIRAVASPLLIEEKDLLPYIERVKWTFDYMLNGGKSTSYNYGNPEDYGWERDKDGNLIRTNELMKGSIYSKDGKKAKEIRKKAKEEEGKANNSKINKKSGKVEVEIKKRKSKDDSVDKRKTSKNKVQ